VEKRSNKMQKTNRGIERIAKTQVEYYYTTITYTYLMKKLKQIGAGKKNMDTMEETYIYI